MAVDRTSQTSVKKSMTSIISDKRNKNEVLVTMTMTSSCTPFVVVLGWPFALFCGLYLECW
jgi:hypothetical protein